MIRLVRHPLGPRVYVLGRRIHEWQLGASVAAVGAVLAAAGIAPSPVALAVIAVGAWLVAKDWQDLVPSRRDTACWSVGVHRRLGDLVPRRRGAAIPPAAAAAAALAGVVNLLSAVTPNVAWRGHLLLRVEPARELHVFHALALPASAGLLLAAAYLARRRRRALVGSVAALVLLGVFDVLKGLDLEEAILSFGLAALLWWARDAFHVEHEPLRLRSAAWLVPGLAAIAASVSALAASAATVSGASTRDVLRAAGALLLWLPSPVPFRDELAWVPLGAGTLSALALASAAYVVLRPLAAPRHLPDPRVRGIARELVREHGRDTLAFFKLRRDAHYLFSPDRRAFAGYRVESGVLIVAGDPVGPDDALPGVIREVRRFADARGLRVGVLGASGRLVPLWRRAGLRALYLGDEAIVETARFSLEGRAIRKVRQSVTRLDRAGYALEVVPAGRIDEVTARELERVSAGWLAGQPDRGFSMAMDVLPGRPGAEDGLVALARDGSGALRGFITFVPTSDGRSVSLSAMRRDRDTPNGLTEFLVARTIALLRSRGVEEVSLNFAAFARVVHAPRNRFERLAGRAVALGNPFFQIESLYRFNAKFDPRWEPRYLVYESRLALPRLGLAALWVEGQVPRPRLRRAPEG